MGIHDRYPPEVHEFVKHMSPKLRDIDLAHACNVELGTSFTKSSMKAFRYNHGYLNGKGKLTSEEYWKYQTRYPQGMYEFIRDNSWNVSSEEMANMTNEKFGTNWTKTGMKQFRQRHGIKSGLKGWFQKGHPPGNKGKKQSEYCSPEAIEKSRKTQFKKGHKPVNELPVGSVVVNSYGYLLRKTRMEGKLWDRWEFVHRAVWEEHNGPVPPYMVVAFKDGNKMHCNIDNLMLITQSENMTLTHLNLRSEDPDLTEAGLNLARVKTKLRKLRNAGDIKTGQNILRVMDEKNITKEELAKMVGVSKYTLWNYIKGYNPVPDPRLGQIANALGVSKQELRP
ncbi:MAG: HNH endonuclease [Oscillospiraceae bacterium]|nr:HNH endonuclease [Oscillospiraceae bacterium]MBO7726998.1 HNH endonuclease [Oscillospiraceae bacterium]